MGNDPKEIVNFRLNRRYRMALQKLARERDKKTSELIREAVEEYVVNQERLAWEAEARRTALEVARAARDPASEEAEMLRVLEETMEGFAEEWLWEEEA